MVACSASAFPEDRANRAEAGCCDYIVKPLNEQRLYASIGEHLKLEWISAPPAAEPPAAATTTDAPDAEPITPAQREELLALVKRGQILKVRKAMEALPPLAGGLTTRLRDAAARLDIKTLLRLLGDPRMQKL